MTEMIKHAAGAVIGWIRRAASYLAGRFQKPKKAPDDSATSVPKPGQGSNGVPGDKVLIFESIVCQAPVPPDFPVTAKVGTMGDIWHRGYHVGTDFSTPIGTPVRCVMDGVVRLLGEHGLLGQRVWVASKDERNPQSEIWHGYGHLSSIEGLLAVGKSVKSGDVVGLSGNTGHSTGPHLHFQMERRVGGKRHFLRPVFV